MTDDIYTRVLEWGEANPGFTLDDLKEKFPEEFEWIGYEILMSKLFTSIGDKTPAKEQLEGDSKKYFLSFEDAFRLLEVTELRESRKTATDAVKFGVIANVVACLALVFTVIAYFFPK